MSENTTIQPELIHSLLAAVRLWQGAGGPEGAIADLHDIATNGGTCWPVSSDELDEFCEGLCTGEIVLVPAAQLQGLAATFQAIVNLEDPETIAMVCDNAITKALEPNRPH